MWAVITNFIIRNRIAFLIGMLAVTCFMGYEAKEVKLSYDFSQVIPLSDTDYVFYGKFKKQFGEDGDLLIIGFQSKEVFRKDLFNSWYTLVNDLKKVKGVQTVASVTNIPILTKDTALKRFDLKPLVKGPLSNQAEADSIHKIIVSTPFYKNLFYNDSTHATLMAIKLDKKTLLSKDRVELINNVKKLGDQFSSRYKIDLAYTGLPYIRTTFAKKIQQELNFFLILSVIVTSIILLLFFRSIYNVIFPLIIIAVIIIWTIGFIVLLDYKLTLLTVLIPPLIVIIAVPNFVYFLNRYHSEFRKYGNKYRAIIMMVKNIARVVFLNNTTTAIGFGVLYFVNSPVLKEFGMVAFIMICAIYTVTLILMPIIFSFLPEPSSRQIHYLNNRHMANFITWVDNIAQTRAKALYAITIIVTIASVYGVLKLKAVGYILDDIPEKDKLYTDLKFFEQNFKGVMPFEITLNTGKPKGVLDLGMMKKIDRFQDSIASLPEFGTTVSIVNLAKYANQAFNGGKVSRYRIPSKFELLLMNNYLKSINMSKGVGMGLNIIDSAQQTARISVKMADVGSVRLAQDTAKLNRDVKAIFGDSIKYRYTGFSLIFLKGNGYLITNLASSLISAILLIIIVIAVLFPSFRLVVITLIPNCLALLITGALMGYFNIPLKPSSVLVFSIAFGIAVDASFHFLVNYRQDLLNHNWDIRKAVTISLKETGYSIIYTSLVLFFGFGIFCFSTFGSTISLGALTSITLLCAMFTNIILIPALLISFDKKGKREGRLRDK